MYCIGSDVRIAVYIFMKGEKMDLNKPDYYVGNRKYEPKDVIAYLNCDFFMGNVIKYIARAGRKPGSDFKTDISKASIYLGFELEFNDFDYLDGKRNHLPITHGSKRASIKQIDWWNSVIEDWGFSAETFEARLCKEVMGALLRYFISHSDYYRKYYLEKAKEFIDRWIEIHQ